MTKLGFEKHTVKWVLAILGAILLTFGFALFAYYSSSGRDFLSTFFAALAITASILVSKYFDEKNCSFEYSFPAKLALAAAGILFVLGAGGRAQFLVFASLALVIAVGIWQLFVSFRKVRRQRLEDE